MGVCNRNILILLFIVLALVLFFENHEPPYTETGTASYYANSLQGNLTANGEIYNHDSLTAAHRTLPLGTFIKVENLDNGKTVVVKVNDRGPFVQNRILDLSRSAFKEISPLSKGIVEVKIVEID
jgi:rare lipoprotein A